MYTATNLNATPHPLWAASPSGDGISSAAPVPAAGRAPAGARDEGGGGGVPLLYARWRVEATLGLYTAVFLAVLDLWAAVLLAALGCVTLGVAAKHLGGGRGAAPARGAAAVGGEKRLMN